MAPTSKSKRRSPRISLGSSSPGSISTATTRSKSKPVKATSQRKIVTSSQSSTASTRKNVKKSSQPKKSPPPKKSSQPKKSPPPKKSAPPKATTSTKNIPSTAVTAVTASRKRSHLSSRAAPPPVLSSSYLEHHKSKNDLVRRLREIVSELSEDDVEPNSPSYPGLDGLASSLVKEEYLENPNKDIRLWTVLACMEIFYLYAPEPPWDESEILRIFSQMIRQLGNLAHCTSPTQANYQHYLRLLEQLSVVKIGCVLVEIAKGDNEEALEMLCSLVQTLLDCVHIDHSSDVSSHVVSAISSCIEEYDETIPIALLDQILTFIADGQVTLVTNPAAVEAAARHFSAKKAGRTPSPHKPPDQISQSNCSYVAAANVLRRTENQLSTPVANLLNSLLNSDTNISSQSQLTREQVFCIIYELHRIAPNILTTVIGHVTNSLLSSDTATRHLAVKLLGKLFQAPTSNIGTQFAPCYREWKDRIIDASTDIRMSVVKYLVLILQNNKPREMRRVATASLKKVLSSDPDVEVRIQAIHDLCDLAYDDDGKDGVCIVVPSLLKAVGDRVKSKHKIERKDALTGLARIYHHRFIKEMTKNFSEDDMEDLDEEYFDSDVADLERTEEEEEDLNLSVPNHLHQKYSWIPNIIVESACFTDSVDSDMRNRLLQIMDDVILSPSLSEHQNAVGFGLFVNSLSDNALKWLDTLWSSRYALQKALDSYLNLRIDLKTCDKVQKVTLEAKVMQQLHAVGNLTTSSLSPDVINLLNGVHTFKDQHTFRLLATIATSTHSIQARQRALEDLPKRLSSLGSNTTSFAKTLARRAAMGTMNTTTFETCLDFAKTCLKSKDIIATNVFLNSIEVLGRSFPPLIGCHVSSLIELYEQCAKKSKLDEGIQEIQDLLIDVFSTAAKADSLDLDAVDRKSLKVSFQNGLLATLNDNGEPDQCRSAVLILGSMVGPNVKSISSLVETLTENNFNIHNRRLDCILQSLSALIECKPGMFNTGAIFSKFQPIVDFVMDIISPNVKNKSTSKKTSKKGKKSVKAKGTPNKIEFSGEHKSNCISSALDFIVSYVRSVVISSKAKVNGTKSKKTTKAPSLSKEFISKVFCHVSCLLSSHDPSEEIDDVRLNVGIGLLRLCDSHLGLAEENVSTNMWYSLVNIFLDPSANVREGAFTEWNNMMLGVDKYCHQDVKSAPALRFLALSSLVPDLGDHSSKKHEPYHIGKYSHTLKFTTLQCVNNLRRLCEQTLAQCQAISREAENNFEKRYKMNVMPEFSVPFAFYLLVFLDETPTSDDIGTDNETLTRKRLKFLLEPLVTSLGDSADNISFLLRMVEIIGKYRPVTPRTLHEDEVSVMLESGSTEEKKLEFLCKTAREVLLSFVKKDVNLTPYPSPIFMPSALFKKKSSRPNTDGSNNGDSANDLSTSQTPGKSSSRAGSAIKSYGRKSVDSSAEKSHVTFSEEVELSPRVSTSKKRRSVSSSSIQDPPDWGDLSPIASDPSPARPRRLHTAASALKLSPIIDRSTPESSEATSSKVSGKKSFNTNRKSPQTPPTPALSQKSSHTPPTPAASTRTVSNKKFKRKSPDAPQTPASSKKSPKSSNSSYKESPPSDSDTPEKQRGAKSKKTPSTSSKTKKITMNKTSTIAGKSKRNTGTSSTKMGAESVQKSRPRRSPRSTLDDSSSKQTESSAEVSSRKVSQKKQKILSSPTGNVPKPKIEVATKNQSGNKQPKGKRQRSHKTATSSKRAKVGDEFEFDDI